MSLRDILSQYSDRSYQHPVPEAPDDFERIAIDAPPEVLRDGLADAFRAEETPPFPQMIAQLYGRSNGQERAGLLNEILGSLAGGAAGGAAGGTIAELLRRNRISPEEADRVTPEQLQETMARAERRDPSIIERASQFYARHPGLVRQLGAAALTIAMRGMARRVH